MLNFHYVKSSGNIAYIHKMHLWNLYCLVTKLATAGTWPIMLATYTSQYKDFFL